MPEGKRTLTWQLCLQEMLPKLLAEAGVTDQLAAEIVADIEGRALDYAASGALSRCALRAPFLEDVVAFEPLEAPLGVKADVAVVVRNSLLEDAHANGPVGDGDLFSMTYLAAGAFNQWLHEQSNNPESAPPVGVFAPVATYPRAFAALQALDHAHDAGGPRKFVMPDAPIPSMPAVGFPEGATVEGSSAEGGYQAHRSGIADIDQGLVAVLEAVAEQAVEFVYVSSLSRYSRNSVVLAQVLEFILAHGSAVLTGNFLIQPGLVHVRRPPLMAPDPDDPARPLRNKAGVKGSHTKYVRAFLRQLG